jgi:phospholipid/cholesterol/gamma-HCH transport system substrate-binding protein
MSKELKTGIIVILIIVAFFWSFNFLKGHDLLGGKAREFKVEYSKIGGLNEASAVTINGLKVGQVKDIEFNETPEKRGHLIVTFAVENDFEFSKKSVVKIYSPNPLAGSNLAIVPSYDGEPAVSGDTLQGEMEESLFTSIGERLDPLQTKLETVLIGADTLFNKINNFLDEKTTNSLKRSVNGLESTVVDVRQTLKSINSLIDSSAVAFNATMKNTSKVSADLAKVTDTLAKANIGEIMRKTEKALTSVNSMLEGMDQGKGTFGKLMNDPALYNNLTSMSKELEELLREMKINPKRFVHFSLFGKRAKAYDKEKNKNNETSQ